MKYLLHFELNFLRDHLTFLRDHLTFLKAQNKITSQLLTISNEVAIRNKKPNLFNTITKFFKELLLCKK